ncbi:HIT domain-containing protein [Terrisporobacter hibernicus]|uniref:HIT domain-containing protein n=1 Tax=Terrisporobacter hibernicus TaxID=2813371 RepID=UPI0023F57AF3|nr:HIT domain-containing protein [Terrisporobacter hibernicus]
MDCLFCKIIDGNIPCDKVYEDDKVLAFNDINPVAPYHILVVPKKHYDSIIDISDKEIEIVAHIHSVINKIAIDKGFSDAGFRIINTLHIDV